MRIEYIDVEEEKEKRAENLEREKRHSVEEKEDNTRIK